MNQKSCKIRYTWISLRFLSSIVVIKERFNKRVIIRLRKLKRENKRRKRVPRKSWKKRWRPDQDSLDPPIRVIALMVSKSKKSARIHKWRKWLEGELVFSTRVWIKRILELPPSHKTHFWRRERGASQHTINLKFKRKSYPTNKKDWKSSSFKDRRNIIGFSIVGATTIS